MSNFDIILRQSYLSGRNEAYENDDNLFFINILNSLIEHSPNNIRHIDNLMKIKSIYYNDNFRDIYEDKNLSKYYEYQSNQYFKSKEMIILELYFLNP